MLVSAIINAAGRKLGLIVSGGTLTADELADGLLALQSMLQSWAAEKINVFSSVSETFSLVAGTASYTWGVGGVINTLRPNQVIGVSILDSSDFTHSVEIISETLYRNISSKTTSSRPYYLFPKYTYPYDTVDLYPTPSAIETLNLDSLKPFTETSSFSATTDTLALPTNYLEPVIYNLAIRLSSEFGVTVPGAVVALARSSYNRLVTLNAANYIEPVKLNFPTSASGRYNINSDSYK